MENDRLYTLDEVAQYLRVHPQSVRRWLRSGTLIGAPIGRAYRIRGADVEAFVEARMGKPTLRRRPEAITPAAADRTRTEGSQ